MQISFMTCFYSFISGYKLEFDRTKKKTNNEYPSGSWKRRNENNFGKIKYCVTKGDENVWYSHINLVV